MWPGNVFRTRCASTDIEHYKKIIDNLKNEYNKQNETNNKMLAILNKMYSNETIQNKQLSEENKQLSEKNKQLYDENKELYDESKELSDKFNELSDKFNELFNENSYLINNSNKLNKLTKYNNELNIKIEQLLTENDKLKKKLEKTKNLNTNKQYKPLIISEQLVVEQLNTHKNGLQTYYLLCDGSRVNMNTGKVYPLEEWKTKINKTCNKFIDNKKCEIDKDHLYITVHNNDGTEFRGTIDTNFM